MPRSSSATRIVALDIAAVLLGGAGGGGAHGQHHPEDGPAGLALELDDPAVLVDDLGNQAEPEAVAARLGRDDRIEQLLPQVLGNPRPVVMDRSEEPTSEL